MHLLRTTSLTLAFALLAGACDGNGQITDPLPGYPCADLTRDCAPWDGAAVSLVLRPTEAPIESSGAQLRVSVWEGVDQIVGRNFTSGDDPVRGAASECTGEWECNQLPTWTVRFGRFTADSVLEGSLELTGSDGITRRGTFRAVWRTRQIMCG